MGNTISLDGIIVRNNIVEYIYSCDNDIEWCFNKDKKFFLEYNEPINNVPKSVLAIPFICLILPFSWILDITICVDELDAIFATSLSSIKDGYKKMYPFVDFFGDVIVNNIINNNYNQIAKKETALLFYSGGVDATCSLISHINEKPRLFTIWGSDICNDDIEGWNNVYNTLQATANRYLLEYSFVKSNFREVISESQLTKYIRRYNNRLEYWHDFEHGIAILAHAIPICWKHGIRYSYIGSSSTPEDEGIDWCASHPWIDNNLCFAESEFINDCYELNRQEKTNRIANYIKENDEEVNLRVCWVSRGGENCCSCEKCYRTIMGLYAEGINPLQNGFEKFDMDYEKISSFIKTQASIVKDWKFVNEKLKKMKKNETVELFLDLKIDEWIREGNSLINPKFEHAKDDNNELKFKAVLKKVIKKIIFWKYIKKISGFINRYKECKNKYGENKKRLILVNTPEHNNIGDAAIAVAEIEFLEKNFKQYNIVEITASDIRYNFNVWSKIISKDDTILIHGGGYLGTLWPDENEIVQKVVERYKDNRIIIFPQTVYYGKDICGIEETKRIYGRNKKKITVYLRENRSYELFKKYFDDICDIKICPDIVFSKKTIDYAVNRSGLVLCFRTDHESVLEKSVISKILSFAEKKEIEVFQTDMINDNNICYQERNEIVERKLRSFAKSSLVITDRMHAMIFCALTGTPCLAIDNISHKVSSTYQWLKDLKYIKICSDSNSIISELSSLYQIRNEKHKWDGSFCDEYYKDMAMEIGKNKE